MTTYNAFLHIMNLSLHSCEPSLTDPRAIPKGPKSDQSTELTTACTLVFNLGSDSEIHVKTMANA